VDAGLPDHATAIRDAQHRVAGDEGGLSDLYLSSQTATPARAGTWIRLHVDDPARSSPLYVIGNREQQHD
jgi:hypothetical protein